MGVWVSFCGGLIVPIFVVVLNTSLKRRFYGTNHDTVVKKDELN